MELELRNGESLKLYFGKTCLGMDLIIKLLLQKLEYFFL